MMINTYQSHMISVAKLYPYAACYYWVLSNGVTQVRVFSYFAIKVTYTPISCAKFLHWGLALSIIHPWNKNSLFVPWSLSPCYKLWWNHPKLLGPGALIFVAKQLWPNSAHTGSSSSEVSIKAMLFQDHTDNTHTEVSPELQHWSSHTSQSLQRKVNLLQNHVQNSKVLQSSNYANYLSVIVSAEAVKDI